MLWPRSLSLPRLGLGGSTAPSGVGITPVRILLHCVSLALDLGEVSSSLNMRAAFRVMPWSPIHSVPAAGDAEQLDATRPAQCAVPW